MKARFNVWLAVFLCFCFLVAASAARAQTFTNSATLSATVSGTNLLISYSLTTTQGWVTLFAADSPELLAAKARPLDLAQVPPAMQGQFTVPIDPTAPARFYKLLIEQWPSRGKALVFVNGPIDFDAMRASYGKITNSPIPYFTNGLGVIYYEDFGTNGTPMIFKQPVEVWLDNLGNYDTNGVLVDGNGGKLIGRFLESRTFSANNPENGFPFIDDYVSSSNDFRVNFLGDTNVPPREAVLWSSNVQLYHDVTDYRNRFFNDAFIDELNLRSDIAANLKQRQFRADLVPTNTHGFRLSKPVLWAQELVDVNGIDLFQWSNGGNYATRTRGGSWASLPPLSICYDTEVSMGDYFGLAATWILGTNSGFPPDAFYGDGSGWQTTVLAPINDGLSAWCGYRYSGNIEIYRYCGYSRRIWAGRACGQTNVIGAPGIPCDKGRSVRNVMMFDEANTTKDGVFPYQTPPGSLNTDGEASSDLCALFFAAIFYDLANDAGLGLHKSDLLFWKTISLVSNNVVFPMREFGTTVQQAARELWPDPRPGRAGLSRYEDDVADVLTSRGIPLNGVADFRTNLPPALAANSTNLDVASANGFGSSHPDSQPSVNFYGNYSSFNNGYTSADTNTEYVAYQFYKHSKYGPCDKLALTDGTFTVTNVAPFNWWYNSNGTYYAELTDRELGNLVVFAPSNHIRWMRSRQRCPNEATGFYAEDVRPFGFRVIQATPNGFSFTASAVSETATSKTYQLTVVDPSANTLGAASYAWSFTNHLGTDTSAIGSVVQYTATKDEPFTLSITRTRASVTDTLTLRERGNDLDRNGGQAFVRNLVP